MPIWQAVRSPDDRHSAVFPIGSRLGHAISIESGHGSSAHRTRCHFHGRPDHAGLLLSARPRQQAPRRVAAIHDLRARPSQRPGPSCPAPRPRSEIRAHPGQRPHRSARHPITRAANPGRHDLPPSAAARVSLRRVRPSLSAGIDRQRMAGISTRPRRPPHTKLPQH